MEEFNLNQNPYHDKNSEPMTVGDWMKTFLLLMIPFANIVLMFVWALGSNVNISKKNYFIANLILSGIVLALYLGIVLLIFLVGGFAAMR